MTADALAARIEAADESQTWEMLNAARYHLRPQPTMLMTSPEFEDWSCFLARFHRLEVANAPYDAAMMLLGDGWKPSRIVWFDDAVEFSMHKGFASATGRHRTSSPLAIAAAAVRAAG